MNIPEMYAQGASLEQVLKEARSLYEKEQKKALEAEEAKKKEEQETKAITDLVNADIRLRNLLGVKVDSTMCKTLSERYVRYANSLKNQEKKVETKIPSTEQRLKDWLDAIARY